MDKPVTISVPPSKSLTHRAYILAAMTQGETFVRNPLRGADCNATLAALEVLGSECVVTRDGIRFCGQALPDGPVTLNCENAGTALRLLTAQAARLGVPITLTGDQSLRRRPNGPLLDVLSELGARVSSAEDGRAPLVVRGPIGGGVVYLGHQSSSQYCSALMMALSQVPGESALVFDGDISSRPYLDLTMQVCRKYGLSLEWGALEGQTAILIGGGETPKCAEYIVEGDWSSAAFMLVAASLYKVPLCLVGLSPHSAQGDRVVVDILRKFGVSLSWHDGQLMTGAASLAAPGLVSVKDCPDLFPVLCGLAACSPGETTLAGAPGLRTKECDRIAVMARGLAALGIRVRELDDGLVIHGGRLSNATIQTEEDHRIRMTFRILSGFLADAVEMDGDGAEAISYPNFERDIQSLLDRRGI